MDRFSGLSEEVGARLSERRSELAKTLRDVATEAGVSVSHLSEIENGRSQVSLPVLLRLTQALELTVGELLPRIGGSRTKHGSLRGLPLGSTPTHHPELELHIEHHRLQKGDIIAFDNPSLGDLLIFVLSGKARIQGDNQEFDLGPGDALDSQRLSKAEVTARTRCQLLTCDRARRGA